VDLRNVRRKIIVELKNKYNTTKATDKKSIYDNLRAELATHYHGYTAYYVEIIPNKRDVYNCPFTPGDNVSKVHRPSNESIRLIDGKSFYALATKDPNALLKLYLALPVVIADILGRKIEPE